MKTTNFKFILIFIVLAGMVLAASPFAYAAKSRSGSVPDFSLKNLDGSTFRFSDVVGKKVIIIDFWATWCKPCKKFMKKLNRIYLDYKENIEVLAISVDDANAFTNVETYIKSKKYSFTVLLDPDSTVARVFNPSRRIPYTMIIDKNGKIVYSNTGYMPGYEKVIIKKIKKLTNEK
jgi:peroxiredoxin